MSKQSAGTDISHVCLAGWFWPAMRMCQVVVHLIETNIDRRLPGYVRYDKLRVRQRAAELYPQAGIPDELMSIFETDDALPPEVTVAKAAVPAPSVTGEGQDPLQDVEAMGVGLDGTSVCEADESLRTASGLAALAGAADAASSQGVRNVVHGPMAPQFNPEFMALAYPFLYPRGGGWCDYAGACNSRRFPAAPRVDFVKMGSKLFAQRVEGQWARDLTHSAASWNMVFRTLVNTGSTYHAILSETARLAVGSTEERWSAADVCRAAKGLVHMLKGSYRTASGGQQPVKGMIRKLYAMDLCPLQRKLLESVDVTAQKIPGTQEVRHIGQKIGEGFGVRYGHGMMWTISPNPANSLLMLHLHRSMDMDPIHYDDEALRRWGQRNEPSLHVAYSDDGSTVRTCGIFIPIAAVESSVPDFATRNRIMAHDPLASVRGRFFAPAVPALGVAVRSAWHIVGWWSGVVGYSLRGMAWYGASTV